MAIWSALLGGLGEVLKPLRDVIDELHTSEEERGKLHMSLAAVHLQFGAKVLEYEKSLNEARANIIMAEARGGSWLQRSWRPITMLTFLGLVVGNALGYLAIPLAPKMWSLMQIGLGGYVVGRSAEKVAPMVVRAISGERTAG